MSQDAQQQYVKRGSQWVVVEGGAVEGSAPAPVPAPRASISRASITAPKAVTIAPRGSVTSKRGSLNLDVQSQAQPAKNEPVSRDIRARSSLRLDQLDAQKALQAERKFNEAVNKRKSVNMAQPGFFGERDTWEPFQNLLKMTNLVNGKKLGEHEELKSETDLAMERYAKFTDQIVEVIKRHTVMPKMEAFVEETFVNPALKECVFVGHVATDLDSIAGAIGAAELFGGLAVKSEKELNGEIKYVLTEVAGLQEPPLFDDTPGCAKPDAKGNLKKICLVDHNEEKQMVKSLRDDKNRKKRIVGVIDHHALAESFSSETPLLIDIRPWGSMSSIVAHMFVRSNKSIPPEIAKVLMCAILSDTLNLQSVTTTDADRFAVAFLARLGNVEDPDEVARLMFRAKTSWIVNLGPYSMCRGDQKDFSTDGWKYGIAVLEVTDTSPVLEKAMDLIVELHGLKIEKGGFGEDHVVANELDFCFLFVVDVVKQCSFLLICGKREYELAREAFPGCKFSCAHPSVKAPNGITADLTLLDVGPLVSRKAQFVPAFAKALNDGFISTFYRVTSPQYVPESKAVAEFSTEEGGVVLDDAQNITRSTAAQKRRSVAVFGA